MPKITITIEDGYKDGRTAVRTRFELDRMGLSEEAVPTDACIVAQVFEAIWRTNTWKGLAQIVCPDVLEHRAHVAKHGRTPPELRVVE